MHIWSLIVLNLYWPVEILRLRHRNGSEREWECCSPFPHMSVCLLGRPRSPAIIADRSEMPFGKRRKRCGLSACKHKKLCTEWGAHWRHLVNTIERYVRETMRTLTVCYYHNYARKTAYYIILASWYMFYPIAFDRRLNSLLRSEASGSRLYCSWARFTKYPTSYHKIILRLS